MDLNNIFNIMAKDAKQSLKNMSLVIIIAIAIFLPLMMSTMMSSITSSASETVMIGVHDRGDNRNYTDFLGTVSLYNVSVWGSLDEMNESIRNGAIVGGIDIPENFDSDIAAGLKPTLNLITDPSSFKSLVFTESCREITMSYAGLEYPLSINTESVVQPAPGSSAATGGFTGFSTPSLLLISILIVGISVLPATLTTEKEKKTISALLASPVTQMDVIMGKAAFGLVLTVMISIIVTFLSNSMTGNIPLVFLFILLGAMAFNGVGLLIAIYSNSYQTASIMSSVIMVPIMMFTFLYQIIDALKVFGSFLPSTYLMNGLNDVILYNKGLSDELVNLTVLVVLTVVIYAIIYVSIQRKGLAG